MRGIEFITGHMVYNLAYNEILQTKETIDNIYIYIFSHLLMANFCHINFCQSRKNGFWWKWRWRKTGMIIKKDHQPAVLMFVLFSTKRQCACYQISHSAPISRATISSSRLVKAISNWVGYQSLVQQVLEMYEPCRYAVLDWVQNFSRQVDHI